MARRTFVVGRLTRRTTEIQYVDPGPAPLPGPWALKAVVRGTLPTLRVVR
jgi:hypothetical protein